MKQSTDRVVDQLQEFEVLPRYRRSIHIVHDELQRTSDYLPTQMAEEIAGVIVSEAYQHSGDRVWTITGPYGSGKSAFGVFLVDILTRSDPVHDAAKDIKRKFIGQHKPMLPILVQASRGPLIPALDQALIRCSASKNRFSSSGHELLQEVTEASEGGVLVIVDEIGQYLEYAAQTTHGDLFVLQQIAETVQRTKKPCIFVGILHSGFGDYLSDRDPIRRSEWQKIQGRFRDVAFIQPRDQMLTIVGKAIGGSLETGRAKHYETVFDQLFNDSFDTSTGTSPLRSVLCQCIPLHPQTALVVWAAFKSKLAQNQRSIFAFLASHEPCAFRSFIESRSTKSAFSFYNISNLYDYITSALSLAVYAGSDSRYWILIRQALERVSKDAPLVQTDLIKSIGLLGIYGAEAGLNTSQRALCACLSDHNSKDVIDQLQELESKSILVYRRHTDSYRLWEGSDFDIGGAYSTAQRFIVDSDLNRLLLRTSKPQFLTARAHSFQTGNQRTFALVVVDQQLDPEKLEDIALRGVDGYILLLFDTKAREEDIKSKALELSTTVIAHAPVVVGVPQAIPHIAKEMRGLETWKWIQQNNTQLAGDPVAKEEIAARVDASQQTFEKLAGSVLALEGHAIEPQRLMWYHAGTTWDPQPKSARMLQQKISQLCAETYSHSPILHNETLNRNKLSSAGSSARRNLIQKILQPTNQPWFNKDRYPPERGFYESMLVSGGFATEDEYGKTTLQTPGPNSTWANVWKESESFLLDTRDRPKPLLELYQRLRRPPYRLREGPLPIFLALMARLKQSEFAIYEDGVFVPDFAQESFERLVRRPDTFSIRNYVPNSGERHALETLSQKLGGHSTEPNDVQEVSIVDIARKIIRIMVLLPRYTLNTRQLSLGAQQIRDLTLAATDPYTLVFEELPQVFDLKRGLKTKTSARTFSSKLLAALKEIDGCYEQLLNRVEESARTAFGTQLRGKNLLDYLVKYLEPLHILTEDLSPLGVFVNAMSDLDTHNTRWGEELARVSRGGKPPVEWNDDDFMLCERQLFDFAAECDSLQQILISQDGSSENHVVSVTSSVGDQGVVSFTVSYPDHLHEDAQEMAKKILSLFEDSQLEDRIKLLAIAHATTELLAKKE